MTAPGEGVPVIMDPVDYGQWLGPKGQGTGMLAALLRPYPAKRMSAFPGVNAGQ